MKNSLIYIVILISINISFASSPKWYIETVDNTDFVGDNTSIKIDSNDYPHISYNEFNYDGELRYAYFDGEKWNIEIVDNNGNIQGSTSLALDYKYNPHIAYEDAGNYDLKYAYFDGFKWNIKVIDSNGHVGGYSSIALDSKYNPHISYYDGNPNYDLKYAYFDGNKWNIEVVDSNGDVGKYSSISIDSKDHPHIAYCDDTNDKPKYAYFDGTKWNIEVIDTNSNLGRCTSIALDKEGNPHVAYLDIGLLKYAYWNRRSWVIKVVDTDHVGGHISLALDSNDYPHISYNYWMDYPDIKRLMYIYFDGNEWHKEIVDNGNGYLVGVCISIDLDRYNYPNISYYKHANLGYARYGYGVGITLSSFSAKPNNDAITLNWSVTTDEEISGFNLYRRPATPTVSPVRELAPKGMPGGIAQSPLQSGEDYVWTKVNTSLITGTNPYSYTDRDVKPETAYEYKLEAVVSDRNETLGTTKCKSEKGAPESFEIVSIYPCPASSIISIDVKIPNSSEIDIEIYDITGRRVCTTVRGLYNSGEYILTSDVSGFTNGVYIVRMTTDGFSASKNFVVAR